MFKPFTLFGFFGFVFALQLGIGAAAYGDSVPSGTATIDSLKEQTLGKYFPKTVADTHPAVNLGATDPDPVELKEFNQRFNQFVAATADTTAFFPDEKTKVAYIAWWNSNERRLITRDRVKGFRDTSLEALFAQSYFDFVQETYRKDGDSEGALARLEAPITNRVVRKTLGYAWAFLSGAWNWMTPVVKGAIIAGPLAGIVNSFAGRFVGPFSEYAGTLGAKWLRIPSIAATNFFNKLGHAKVAEVKAARTASAKLAEIEARIPAVYQFPGMTPEQAKKNWEDLNDVAVVLTQTYSETMPNLAAGRGALFTAVFDVHRTYTTSMAVFHQNFETHRKPFEEAETKLRQKVPEEQLHEFLLANDRLSLTASHDKDFDHLKADIESRKLKLKALGVTDAELQDVTYHYENIRLAQRQSALTLAEWIMFQFDHPEYSRKLATRGETGKKLSDSFSLSRDWLGFQYYVRENDADLKEVLKKLQLKVDLIADNADATLKEMTGLPATEGAFASSQEPVGIIACVAGRLRKMWPGKP